MHSHHDHLVRRSNGTFHFRLVLPYSLKRSLGKREVHHSLKTKKRRVAIPRANQLYKSYMEMKQKEKAVLYNILFKLADGTEVEIDQEDPEQELRTAEALLRTAQSSSSESVNSTTKDLSNLVTAYLEDTKGSD